MKITIQGRVGHDFPDGTELNEATFRKEFEQKIRKKLELHSEDTVEIIMD